MTTDLRIVVRPAGRAATVANARLQGLQLDTRARRAQAEGEIPVGFRGDDLRLDREDGVALIVWTLVCAGAFLTGYSLGGLIVEWWVTR